MIATLLITPTFLVSGMSAMPLERVLIVSSVNVLFVWGLHLLLLKLFPYLIHHPTMVKKFLELGYPLYTLDIIGMAKLIGVIALAIPKFPRLKEWAYAGFFIDFVAGFWSHAVLQGLHGAITLVIPTILLVVSYTTFRKLQAASAAAAFAVAAANH